MQFSTKIDGFEQKDSQGFENSYNSYPLEKFFIFTIYKNYTLALIVNCIYKAECCFLLFKFKYCTFQKIDIYNSICLISVNNYIDNILTVLVYARLYFFL